MFGTFRKHQSWLLVIIIGVVIVAFVLLFSPDIQWSSIADKGDFGSIGGEPITTEQFRNALKEAHIAYLLRTGRWPDSPEARQEGVDVRQDAYHRILLIRTIEEMNLEIGPEAVVDWVRLNQPFLGQISYDQMVSQVLPTSSTFRNRNSLSEEDFYRFIKHEVGISHLVSLFGLPGRLVTPQEAERLYRQQHRELATQAVLFNTTNHLDQVTNISPEVLGQFYTNRMAEYRQPERIRIRYVRFPSTNFMEEAAAELAGISDFEVRVEQEYQRRGTNAFIGPDDQPLPREEALQQIRSGEQERRALLFARRKAGEFAEDLTRGDSVQPDRIETLAGEWGLEIESAGPFDRTGDGAANLPASVAGTAFRLSGDNPFAGPVLGPDAAYVIGYSDRFPSEVRPLEEVLDRVREDFVANRARELARESGNAFHRSLTNRLAGGDSFADVAADAEVNVEALPPFSLTTESLPGLPPELNLSTLKNVAFGLEAGEASRFIPTINGGFVLHVREEVPVDETAMKEELEEFTARLRRSRQFAAFSDWFQYRAEQARLNIPDQEQPEAP
ncbi:MAG TPA: SurA N-terminal domain-containing protein [Methylomirabilota bacterium]|nr:SurA N-terminal domain-containing protein [Methylomirabilota bacterium]